MSRRFQFSLRALLVVLLPLSGCVPSEQPLVSEKESIADCKLLGTWRYEDDDPRDPFVIREKPGSETVLEAVHEEEHVDLLLTKIADERYLCVQYSDDPVQ
jgi:inorganic pyrophosphatase